jgi:hypothetical protein
MKIAPAGRAAGGLRAPLLWIGTACTIVAGYALLARGGTTAPAALLVLGYVVLAPMAILGARRAGIRSASGERPPYAWAALAAAAVLALYIATLAPSTAMWDTSEYMVAAKVLGIPHPPGNPLFILVAYLFGMLPLAREYAVRINLLAAVTSAASAGLWFLIAHEITRKLFEERWARLVAAGACALIGATSFTVWNQSVVNEKVYTLCLFQLTLVMWLAVCWTRAPDGIRADRLLVVISYLLALGYTIHPAGLLAGPAVAAVVLLLAPRTLLRGRLVARVAAAGAMGVSLFAFEPIRSANHPALNEGEPTACADGFAVKCTLSLDTLDRLRAHVTREQYGKPDLSARQASFGAQLGMWWQYFTWQWFRDPHGAQPAAQLFLALLALALALAGASLHARTDRPTFVLTAALVATVTVALVFYLNFKYGYTQSPELGGSVDREVRDRDYFFIWSFSCLGVWAGLGIVQCWRSFAERLARPRALAIALPVVAIAFLPLTLNARAASRAGETFTADFARDLLGSVAPNGILVTNGDNDTFPLWYAQEVEGYRKDVVVVIATYLNTDWFPRQLMRRGIAVAGSPEESDSVPPVLRLAAAQRFDAGDIHATIPAGYLTRDQIFMLQIVRDVLPHRPVYFTSSIYPRALGLERYLVTEGLAVRLMPTEPVESSDLVRTSAGLVAVERSLSLWRDTFKGRAAFERQNEWIDPASLVMPAQYIIAGSVLAESLAKRGSAAESATVAAEVQRMMGIAHLGSIFGRGD